MRAVFLSRLLYSVSHWPEILEFHLVAGDFDYLLKLRNADMAWSGNCSARPCIRDSRTLVAMETVQESTRLVVRD